MKLENGLDEISCDTCIIAEDVQRRIIFLRSGGVSVSSAAAVLEPTWRAKTNLILFARRRWTEVANGPDHHRGDLLVYAKGMQRRVPILKHSEMD